MASNKGVQAIALGLSQIVSDLPALVEVGAQQGQGITVTPEDAVSLADGISGLLANPERLAKVAHTARVVAKQCTWGHRASQYQQLYEALR